MNANVKILPFKKSPVVGFLGHANVLGILSNYEECMPWFYSNYIQLYFSRSILDVLSRYWLDFYPNLNVMFSNVPWFEYHRIDKETIVSNDIDIIKFAIDYINRDYYVFSYVDDFYIPNKWAYQKQNYIHDIFIYGYDLDKQVLNEAGFDYRFSYQESELNFDIFRQAYAGIPLFKPITLLKKLEKDEDFKELKYGVKTGKYSFNLRLVVEMLTDYLYSRNSIERVGMFVQPDDDIFGIKVYEYLQLYFQDLIDEKGFYDIKPIHILWEHKSCMLMRLKYMHENNYLKNLNPHFEAFSEIERHVVGLRNSMIKYYIQKDKKILRDIISTLPKIAEKETIALENLIKEIYNSNPHIRN